MSFLAFVPNLISFSRICLIIPFLNFLLNGHYQAAFFTFLIAGITDGIDGKIARAFHCESKFGSYLDPLSDKLFILSSIFALTYLSKVPLPLTILIFARDLLIFSAVLVWKYGFRDRGSLKPTLIGKSNMVLQIAFILIVLYQLAFSPLTKYLYSGMIALLVCTSIISLLQYACVFNARLMSFYKD